MRSKSHLALSIALAALGLLALLMYSLFRAKNEAKLTELFEAESNAITRTVWQDDAGSGVTALMTVSNVNATTSFAYDIYVGREGLDITQNDKVFAADKTSPIQSMWLDEETLEICYNQAQIWHYTNFYDVRMLDGTYRFVDILLRQSEDC